MYVRSAAELKIPGCVNSKPLHRAMKGSLLEAVVEGAVVEGAVVEGAVVERAVVEGAVVERALVEGAVVEPLLGLETSSLWHPAVKLRMTTSAGK
jgi:hypothetical protein